MSKPTFSISVPAKDYQAHLRSQGVDPTPKSPFSTATNYREFMGRDRAGISDQPMTDLGITNETIAECVPSAMRPK